MYLRYGRHLEKSLDLHQVLDSTPLPSILAQDAKTQAMVAAGELYMLDLHQLVPSDFELETAMVITDPFVVESLKILRRIRTNP